MRRLYIGIPCIGIRIGDVRFDEVIGRLNDWLEENIQSLQPGEERRFSHEGEFRIPGVGGKLRLTLELFSDS